MVIGRHRKLIERLSKVCVTGVVIGCFMHSALATPQQVRELIATSVQGQADAGASQKRIDQAADDQFSMLNDYREAQKQIASLKVYNQQVQKLIEAQNTEMQALQEKISSATSIGRQITPLMLNMLDSIEKFVSLDTPFLLEERKARVANLRDMMNRADVSESEKYRRILEAYQIENEYGRTLEAYQGSLEREGKTRTADYLRVGRVLLIYQTLDGSESGVWDREKKQWTTLPSSYASSINKGLRVARKQVAPDLLRLPMTAPEVSL